MDKTQIFHAEVDSDGILVGGGLVLIDENYKAAINDSLPAIQGKSFKLIENNQPDVSENQTLDYTGWSQKPDGSISANWEVTTISSSELVNILVRHPREMLLASSDWTQAADSPLSTGEKANWATYRAELRDLTANVGTITSKSDITWPTPPGVVTAEIPS